MSDPPTPLESLALRIAESTPESWWLVVVPNEQHGGIAETLRDEIIALGVTTRCLPADADTKPATVTLISVNPASSSQVAASLEVLRSRAQGEGAIVLIVAESAIATFLQQAPHVASFVGGKIFSSSLPRNDAPPEYVERRLDSLRASYGMSDDEAKAALAKGEAPDQLDFIEWMVLLGDKTPQVDS